MKSRYVVIEVDDPTVTHATVALSRPWRDTLENEDVSEVTVPVPPDDQIAQDVEALWEWAEATYRQAVPGAHEQMLRPYLEGARRLRAAFHLDEEDE